MTYNPCHLNNCNSGIEGLYLAEITQEAEKWNEMGMGVCVI